MTSVQYIEFPVLPIKQPIGTFWIGAISAQDLVRISYADIRGIKKREIEEFAGIQRPLSKKRTKELKQYVQTIDASFPTSVILAIYPTAIDDNKHPLLDAHGNKIPNVLIDEDSKIMSIRDEERVAQIIDGQHRIAGLDDFKGTFEINVVIFIDMYIEDQSNMFATINLQQTKVNKSLAYDLYEYAQSRSPQKTAHNIAKLFNRDEHSPFQGRIKLLGKAMGGTHEFLTQAAFIDRLLPLISDDPMDDRDRLKRGRKLARANEPQSKKLVFRNLFIDEQDAKIARILWNYFKAVAECWPNSWFGDDQGNILPRTNGFAALMRFFVLAYIYLGKPGDTIETEAFLDILKGTKLKDGSFTKEHYLPGTSGQTKLFNHLKQNLPEPPDLFNELE